jgi:DNA-binding NtrC family response regulator
MTTFDSPPNVLIADDQADIREALRLLLKGEGFETDAVSSPRAVFAALEKKSFDVLLVDLNYARDTTSGHEGLDLLARIQSLDSNVPVVVMTAWATVDLAVEAMRHGARDFVQKPWDNARLVTTLSTQIMLRRALRQAQRLETENSLLRSENVPTMIAESATMRPVLDMVRRVGPSDANILVIGEHGTGKEVIARILHSTSSRAAKPMVTVNAGGLPEGVFESELFGHVKGAFTDARSDRIGRFELADCGTLFLDEIGNVPLRLQPKLLRALQSGEIERVGSSQTRNVNVRVITATNANLAAEVHAGNFREDLLFRINTIEIRLPPLRERREDIPLLAGHFLRRYTKHYRKFLSGIEPAALQGLLEYPWPGNIRELDHAIERAVLLAPGEQLRLGDLALGARRELPARPEDMSLEEIERFFIRKALARYGGNVSRAADALDVSRSAFYRRLQKYGL